MRDSYKSIFALCGNEIGVLPAFAFCPPNTARQKQIQADLS
jgi:hypothetical protein